MEKSQWVTGSSEEYFSGEKYATKEAAIEGGKEEYGHGDDFYVGRVVPLVLSPIDSDSLLESIMCGSENEEKLGDWSENWMDKVTTDKKLAEYINGMLKEICTEIMRQHPPQFFNVEDTELVVVQ